MSDPAAMLAQAINAIEKLLGSWKFPATLIGSGVVFVFIRKVFSTEPFVVTYLFSLGVSSLFVIIISVIVLLLNKILLDISFQMRHNSITDEQLAILNFCLTVDESWFDFGDETMARQIVDEPLQRFIEAGLAHVDQYRLRFNREYWKWLNPRRRKILARPITAAAKKYVEDKIEQSSRRLGCMAY